jgi:hypothetical protein
MGHVFIAFIFTSFRDLKGRADTGFSTMVFVENKMCVTGMVSSGVFFIIIFVKCGNIFKI